MIEVQASYHARFTMHGAPREAWIERDDRAAVGHWYVFGYVSEELQEAEFTTSQDAMEALRKFVNPDDEVTVST